MAEVTHEALMAAIHAAGLSRLASNTAATVAMALLAEAPSSAGEAELRAQNDLLWDDLTRTLAERNAVADVAASHVQPGPDGEDYAARAELVQAWLDEARDQVEEDGTVPSLNDWLVPETRAMRELTRKDLRLRLRRGLKRLRDAKQRTAQVAAQRDHARRALATIQEHLAAEAPQRSDSPERYSEYVSDLRSASRAVRSQSWPLEMGEWADKLADRLARYADEPPVAEAPQPRVLTDLEEEIVRSAADWFETSEYLAANEAAHSRVAGLLMIIDDMCPHGCRVDS